MGTFAVGQPWLSLRFIRDHWFVR